MKSDKLNIFECLAVEWVKSKEKNSPQEPEKFDIDAEWNKTGEMVRPYRYLADRAEKYLEKNGGISRFRGILKSLFWIPVLLAVILGGLIYPIARADSILGNGLVSLAGGYFWFLVWQIFFLTLSLISLAVLLIRGLGSLFRNKKPEKKPGNISFLFGFIGFLIIRAGRWVCQQINWGKVPFLRKGADSADPAAFGAESGFWPKLFQQDRTWLFFAGFLSHLFWFTLSLILLFVLMVRMTGNRYDYCWNSSLLSPETAQSILARLAQPVDWLISAPNEDQFHWLFENSVSPAQKSQPVSVSTRNPEDSARIRFYWSRFLLAVVLIWAILPRGIMGLTYFLLFRRSLRDFVPPLDDPYYASLLDQAKFRITQIREQAAADAEPDSLGDLVCKKEPETALPVETEEKPKKETPVLPKREISILCGYDTEFSPEWGQSLLGSEKTLILGNLARRSPERDLVLKQLENQSETAKRLILILDLTQSPARQTERFLLEKIFQPVQNANLIAVLSCGNRLGRKLDADGIRIRIDDWRRSLQQMGQSLGTEITIVDFYDHELDLADSRRRLIALLSGGKETGTRRTLAGKFDEAVSLILENTDVLIEEKADSPIADRLAETLRTGYDRLLALYREEIKPEQNSPILSELKEKLALPADSLRALADKAGQKIDPDGIKEKIAAALAMVDSIKDFTKKLSPKSALIFGSAGLALPFLPILLPIGGSAAGVGTLIASLGTLLPASMTSAGIGAAAGAMLPAGLSALGKRLGRILPFGKKTADESDQTEEADKTEDLNSAVETAVLSLTGWGVLFELQSFPDTERGNCWAEALKPFESVSVIDRPSAVLVLAQVKELLQRLESGESAEK